MPEVITVKYAKETLEENCLRQNILPSLAYGFKGCSQKYKIQPQDKFVNNWRPAKDCWKAGGKCLKLMWECMPLTVWELLKVFDG
jgi:hypothetical protein